MKATQSSPNPSRVRGIRVNDRHFYWFVALDDNAPDVTCRQALNILSEDREFMVRYHLNQADPETRHITVLGTEFAGKRAGKAKVRRYRVPDWMPGASLTGRQLAGLIAWCLSGKEERVEVDINGFPLSRESMGTRVMKIAPAIINRFRNKENKAPDRCGAAMARATGVT